jgi:hypothetical protein
LLNPATNITTSAFKQIVQDGTQLQFKSVTQNRYLVADQGGGAAILADRVQASGWETFKVVTY